MVDVVAALRTPLAPASDAPATISLRPGGSAANTACWLASAGTPAALIARVGDDTFGQASLMALECLDLQVSVDPDRPTGTCIVLVDPTGERTMVPDAGANAYLDPAALPSGRHLHVSAYALLRPSSRAAVVRAVAAARSGDGRSRSTRPRQPRCSGRARPCSTTCRTSCCLPIGTRRSR